MQTLILATENAGKKREFLSILSKFLPACQVLTISDLASEISENYLAEETGTTYAENALIKARALSALLYSNSGGHDDNSPPPYVVAEDSGFEVSFLNGAPGVYSARYAGDDDSRCAKVLHALHGAKSTERGARFVACVVLLEAQQSPVFFMGRKNGIVATEAKGTDGFGYDPIFIPEGYSQTWGEMQATAKQNDSHRGAALALAIQYVIARSAQK